MLLLSFSSSERKFTGVQIQRFEEQRIPRVYGYEIIESYEHDKQAFTQGLQFEEYCSNESPFNCTDVFLESTGLYGSSTVRRVEVATGRVLNSTKLERKYFGEGLVRLKDRVYQLTWHLPVVLVYDPDLSLIDRKLTPLKDGWGLTSDERLLIMTDSGSHLYWIDPETFSIVQEQTVRDGDQEINELNELEWIDGQIWANIWMKDCIAIIDPADGLVHGWVDLQGLKQNARDAMKGSSNRIDVLNGIAYDADRKRLFVTGKWWPRMYEIRLKEIENLNDTHLEQVRRFCIP